jgi:hypothetical protein
VIDAREQDVRDPLEGLEPLLCLAVIVALLCFASIVGVW